MEKLIRLATLLLLAFLHCTIQTQDDSSQLSDMEEIYNTEDEREYEADIFVRQFVEYVRRHNLETIVYPDFRRGRSVAYNVSSNAYWASEQQMEQQETIDCGNLIPESYDFYRCNYTIRAALVRRRFAMPSRIENDCAMHEHDIQVTNFSSNPMFEAWGINCDCQDGFISDTAQSLADLGVVASARPSTNGMKCEANFTFSRAATQVARSNLAYVLGCDFKTGKINLLPLSSGFMDAELSLENIETVESGICKCNDLQGPLKRIMFSECANSEEINKSPTISDDSSTCRLASNRSCQIALPNFLKMGHCNFSTNMRSDEAIFLTNGIRKTKVIEVPTLHPLCDCNKHIFAKKFDMCDYSQNVGLVTTYQGTPSVNGSACEVLETHNWPPKDECNCKSGHRYVAPPLCHIIKNNKTVTHAWTAHDNNKHCVGAAPEQINEQEYNHAEYTVYDPKFSRKMREEHANLRAILEELFNEPLQSSCDCTRKVLRIPIGCDFSSSSDSEFVMRFLVLTRHRGKFFCTVSKKLEVKMVNPKFCSRSRRTIN